METWALETRQLGRNVHVCDALESTNNHAFSLAQGPAQHGLIVLARHQTAGRGQHGRRWLAPPESSVLLSALLFPLPELQRPVVLTAWAAVAVAEFVLEATGEQARIKWPNDVYLKGKKICGILIEQRRQGDGPAATVVGVGLNVAQPASFFEEAELPLGGSLLTQTGTLLPWEDAARRLIRALDEEYELLMADRSTLESMWIWRLGLLGRQVAAETGKGVVRGRLIDMDFDRVRLATQHGEVELTPEAIQRLRADATSWPDATP
jgi:BirA family biotin operon repressor/biotin-[acetyl-CoA-carboxylase] ligase